MALNQEAMTHYKSLFDSAESDIEREELRAGIEAHHAQDNYLVQDSADLRKIGQQALGRVQPEQNKLQNLASQPNKDALINASGGDILTGLKRGVQSLQAMSYGATALAGSGLKKIGLEDAGQATQDFGMEGYRRNIEEAKKYPSRHSFKDVYTGEAGVGGAINWAKGTFGELIPSMAEAAVGALIGATAGSAVGPEGTVGGGVVGAFAGRTILKKSIEKGVQQAVKKGLGKVTEREARKAITRQALKKLGGKIGLGAAVMPIESGGMYANLLENKGIDAPETALLFGALSTAMEYVGGNSKLVDTFVDALSKGGTGLIKKSAKELLTNIPQEALQEGGQEVMSILNTFVNTDEKFWTAENMEQIIESMGAGAIGGGAGAVIGSTLNTQGDSSSDYEKNIKEKFDNITSLGADKIPESISALDQKIVQNNQMLQNEEMLGALAAEKDIQTVDLKQFLINDNEFNQDLKTRLQTELENPGQSADQTEQTTNELNVSDIVAQRQKQIQELDIEIDSVRNDYLKAPDSPKRTTLGERLTALVAEKKALVEGVAPEQTFQKTLQTPEEKQALYEKLFGTVNSNVPITENNSAQASAEVLVPPNTSSFIDEQQLPESSQVGQTNQVSMVELENQLAINEQQLSALAEQITATTDSNERIALQQEGSVLYEENAKLQDEWNKQYQEQNQFTKPEANAEFQVSDQIQANQLSLTGIQNMFPNQQVYQADDGTISIQFKNGKGVTFKSIQDAGQGFIKLAIETGQMSKNGKILGITVGNDVLLDANYADDKTMWHENKHLLDNLGMITNADNSALNKEFNRLRKADKLGFAISTHKNPIQRMKENRANMFAQIMTDRAVYRDKPLGKMIQKVMDFFQQLFTFGQQSITGLAREVESGKIYERQVNDKTVQTNNKNNIAFNTQNDSIAAQALSGQLTKTSTNTPAFNNWFSDSVAKKKDGSPIELYHGTDQVFETFNKDGESNTNHATSGLGHFFTTKKKTADSYGQHTLPVYLKMNKPYKMSLQEAQTMTSVIESKRRQDELKADGFDSVIIETGDAPYVIVFDSGQIKSVYNQGAFKSPENIYFQTREQKNNITNLFDVPNNIASIRKDLNIAGMGPSDNGSSVPTTLIKTHQQLNTGYNPYEIDIIYNQPIKIGDSISDKHREIIGGYRKGSIKQAKKIIDRLKKENRYDKIKEENPHFTVESIAHDITYAKGDSTASWARQRLQSYGENNIIQFPSEAQFQVRDSTEQKLTDQEYNEGFKEKNNLVQSIMQTIKIRGHEAKLLADRLTGSISTRLANANPMLRDKMRRLDFNTSQKIIKVLHIAKPLLEKTKKMSPKERYTWDLARKEADTIKINQITQKHGMEEDMLKLRDELDKIRQEAIDVGYDVGFINDYWPRIIKDTEGFLQATQGISQQPEFTNAIRDKAKQMGITVDELKTDFPDVRADIISNMILSQSAGIGGPGNIQGRVFEKIPKEYRKFYMDSDAALMQYIYSMTKKIEARKFFGKVPPKIQKHKLALAKATAELTNVEKLAEQSQDNTEVADVFTKRISGLKDIINSHEKALNKYKNQRDYTENIGAYIDGLMISGDLNKKDEHVVRDILNARFNEHGTSGVVNAYKNLAYIDVMGNPISALTQIGDLAWAAYVGKIWTPRGFKNTTKNIINATLNKSKMTKEDLGLERIAQEFADGTTLGNSVSWVFNRVGLTKMDSIGKETLINNALMNYQEQIKTEKGRKDLEKQIHPIFGAETRKVIEDLATDTHSDNVKMLIYSRLLDFQPAALSEMPEYYLKGGNGRVFYMLKTYTLKQFDVFRNEIFHEIKSGDPQQIRQGLQNMVGLLSMLTLANAGADELKDLVLGREVSFKDNVIDNFLTMGGVSRYKRMQITRDGLGTALAKQILPPFKLVNAAWSDISEKITNGEIDKGLRSVDSIPGIGKLAYWHYGRGSQTKKTLDEQDFSKANKRFRKFKKQFDKADDKRLFLHSNPAEFRQMKLYQNFQTALNGNKATINKLKKLKQTPNVIKRLGQLNNQRKMFLNNYFKAAENLTMQ